MDADVVVVGAGLAGLVATAELVAAGRRVALVDQESTRHLGGQAWWSFGGLFLVDTPEQRRMGIADTRDLAWQDWTGTAGFDRLGPGGEDGWGQRWARAYVDWASGEKRAWLRERGVRFFPVVGWAERGDGTATGHGNSVPRFHIVWGTGPAIVEPFERQVRAGVEAGLVTLHGRHRVTGLVLTDGAVTGVRCDVLREDGVERGMPSTREVVGQAELSAQAVVVTSGGIGANADLVRRFWPDRLGTPPQDMVTGVPAYVDGSMLDPVADAGARLVNRDRMWHYTEGLANHAPVWPGHGIRILPGPSSLWLDGSGRRLPAPYFPGFDTLGTLAHLRTAEGAREHDHSWFVATRTILGKEYALSGSEQNPDLTGRSVRGVLGRVTTDVPGPLRAFVDHGADVVEADTPEKLAAVMNALVGDGDGHGEGLVDGGRLRTLLEAHDRELDNDYGKDLQTALVRAARRSRGDRLVRTAPPHRFLDPDHGPLVALRLRVLTRKTLGGVQTDLDSRALDAQGDPVPGLYAAGEVAGFGGGGVHGYRSLEGTFLGGCLFSGRAAGRALARDL
ncbi:FAD-binding dehydrogenase [Ornithinimicrobium sp. CNJ-824]|uniref:FAD-binding dehydrogenase n=1 Tax=Ornithinimicrobium sp. CNJ-824 TaxID=1904966 RepID=UPI00095EE868|nr:FAD-binding dehydrogenase [Ornithinimicrobium sp. CNJ-824]OLT23432.1 FAD-binding dehydrogenase [Ornithinimicrobium sp. CNJ-824]